MVERGRFCGGVGTDIEGLRVSESCDGVGSFAERVIDELKSSDSSREASFFGEI